MLVEYDVLARDHQDAQVSFIILIIISFCQWYQVLLIYFFFIVTGKRGSKAKWSYAFENLLVSLVLFLVLPS